MKFVKKKTKSKLGIYLELSKLNILSLVLVSTFLGYYIGASGINSWPHLLLTLIGTSMTASGSGALNHYLERETDKHMMRTKNRPLPTGSVNPSEVLSFGVITVLLGTTLLVSQINILTGFIALLTSFLYIVVYTPLKKLHGLILLLDQYLAHYQSLADGLHQQVQLALWLGFYLE